MRAGELREKLELLKPIMVVDEYGAEKKEYKSCGVIHAQRVKQKGYYAVVGGERFPDYKVEFYIRGGHSVAENWRIRHIGGYLYDVLNIVPTIERGMKTLICDRVNE